MATGNEKSTINASRTRDILFLNDGFAQAVDTVAMCTPSWPLGPTLFSTSLCPAPPPHPFAPTTAYPAAPVFFL